MVSYDNHQLVVFAGWTCSASTDELSTDELHVFYLDKVSTVYVPNHKPSKIVWFMWCSKEVQMLCLYIVTVVPTQILVDTNKGALTTNSTIDKPLLAINSPSRL